MTNELGSDMPPVDFARIQDTSDGDVEFERELFTIYVEDCAERIDRLRAVLAAGDSDALRRDAHTIKGASANVGTTQLQGIALELERCEISETDRAAELIGQLEAEFARVREAIDAYVLALGA